MIKVLLESNRIYLDQDFDQVYKLRQRKRPSSTPWTVRFLKGVSDIFLRKKCFVCYEGIRVPYLACDGKTCQLLYCEQCSLDINFQCLNCRRKLGGQVILR